MTPVACNTAVSEDVENSWVQRYQINARYYCNKDKEIVFEVDAASKDALAKALEKSNFPGESIMETENVAIYNFKHLPQSPFLLSIQT